MVHIYILQLIRYSQACHNMTSFLLDISCFADGVFGQGFPQKKLIRTCCKFMGTRYPELASKFDKSPPSMICDSVPMAELYLSYLPSVDEIVIVAGSCAQSRACLLLRTPDSLTD